MGWLKEILDENRRTVESWPEWKRRVGMSTDQMTADLIRENAHLKVLLDEVKRERDDKDHNCQVMRDEAAQLKAALNLVHVIVEHDGADFDGCCASDIVAEAAHMGLDGLLKLKVELVKAHEKAEAFWNCIQEEMAENVAIFELLGVHREIKEGRAGSDVVREAIEKLKDELVKAVSERDDLQKLYNAGKAIWNPVYQIVVAERDQLKAELAQCQQERDGACNVAAGANHLLLKAGEREARLREALQMLVDKNENSCGGLVDWAECWDDAKQALKEAGT